MRAFSGNVLSSLIAVSVISSSTHALAQTTRYELDAAAPLSADGWTFIESGSTSSFDAGLLRLQSAVGYAEWMLRAAMDKPTPTTGWLADAKAGRGWWVEARVRISTATKCIGGSGPGLWIDDGKFFTQLHLDATTAHLQASQNHDFAVNGSDFHVYRWQSLGARHFQLLIDGAVVYDDASVERQENGKALMFGDLGGCDATDATWDYLAFDAYGPKSPPGDADSDGVANALDNCVLLANADQADGDHDGVGDACDICPQDAKDDQDNDGLCADQDVCPEDGRNDMDKDGVCDTIECAPYQVQTTIPGRTCPAICLCLQQIGNDPIGGFGNLDNFGGTYPVGTGGVSALGGGNSGAGGAPRGGNAAGGAVSTNGNGNGNQAASPSSTSDNAGCACRVGQMPQSRSAWLAPGLLLTALALAFSRRSGRSRPS